MNKEKAPDAVRLNAAKDILDRWWYKPTDKTELTWASWWALEITWNIVQPTREVLPNDWQ
jgi:hypothetical protein